MGACVIFTVCSVTYKCIILCVGHITIGGSICMQMLTRSGWSPSNDIEVSIQLMHTIIQQVNVAI